MRYFLYFIIGILAAIAVYCSIFIPSLGRTDSRSALMIQEWYRYKVDVAESLPSPRIVIVSGSNALYGINARKIEDETGIPTVNFATHAGLSREYLLHRARQILKKGDTVILALEYELYFPRGINPVFSDYVLGADPAYLATLPIKDRIPFGASASFQMTLDRLGASRSHRKSIAQKAHDEALEHFDDRGDMIANHQKEQTANAKRTVDQLRPNPLLVSGNWADTNQAWADIADFARSCAADDIKVLATFPNTVRFPDYQKGGLDRATAKLMSGYAQLNVPTLGTPGTFLFEHEDFFDTIYHLNHEAGLRRTEMLLAYLKPLLVQSPPR